jgi:hypothetical protein
VKKVGKWQKPGLDEYDRALCEHYGKMLGLEPGWEVNRVELSTQTMKLELGVEWLNAGAICAECGKKCTRHDLAPERRWRHLARWDSRPRLYRALRERTAERTGFIL